MRTTRIVAGTLLYCSLSVPIPALVFAYDEPDNFAGLKFGEALSKQIAECPYMLPPLNSLPNLTKIRASGARCYARLVLSGEPFYVLFNMGDFQEEVSEIQAELWNGNIAQIRLMFPSSNASNLLAIFEQRYGKPTAKVQQPWMSKGGLKTTSLVAYWKGTNVSIIFNERYDTVDTGIIMYSTSAFIAEGERLKAEAIRKRASGL